MTTSRAFAMVGLGLAIAGVVGTALVRLLSPAPFITVAFGFGPATMVGYLIEGLSWASIGALLVVRRPENAVGWLMVLIGAGHALAQLSVSVTFAFAAEGTVQGARLAQIAGWGTVLLNMVGILQVAIGFLYPSGRAQSRGWARFMRFFWALAIAFVVVSLSQPGPLQIIPGLQNPFGFGPDLRGGRPLAPILVPITAIILVGLAISMVSRYRAAGSVERHQIKWFVLGSGVSAIGLGILVSEALLMNRPTGALGLTVHVFAGALVPVAIGIAILRYRLYEIDRIISRTISYGVVTAVLVAVFAIVIVGLQTALTPFIGDDTLPVAASTLVVFALFQPLRRRVQSAIDRRFDRARYNGERTAAAFAGRLRDEVDLNSIVQDLRSVVGASLQPGSASVWIRSRNESRTLEA